MDEITPSVFVPQRARINKTFAAFDQHSRFPTTRDRFRFLGADTEDTNVRISVIDIEPSGMMADRRCPDAATGRARVQMSVARNRVRQSCIDNRPFHAVAGLQDLQTRYASKGAIGHIIVLPHTNHIRIGIIVRQDRVGVTRSSRFRLACECCEACNEEVNRSFHLRFDIYYFLLLKTTVSLSTKFRIPDIQRAKMLQISTSHPPEKRSMRSRTHIFRRNVPVQERLYPA